MAYVLRHLLELILNPYFLILLLFAFFLILLFRSRSGLLIRYGFLGTFILFLLVQVG